MPTIYRPRRLRASPLWQIPRPAAKSNHRSRQKFYRCGDLAQGFTCLHCPDCGHEKLVAFTCKTHGYCPSRHQCRALETADWIAKDITFDVPAPHAYMSSPFPRFCAPSSANVANSSPTSSSNPLKPSSFGCKPAWIYLTGKSPPSPSSTLLVTTWDSIPHLHILATNDLIDAQNRFHPLDENAGLPSSLRFFEIYSSKPSSMKNSCLTRKPINCFRGEPADSASMQAIRQLYHSTAKPAS